MAELNVSDIPVVIGKGKEADLNNITGGQDDDIYITTDTNRMFRRDSSNTIKELGDNKWRNFVKKNHTDYTWEEIAKISASGNARKLIPIGNADGISPFTKIIKLRPPQNYNVDTGVWSSNETVDVEFEVLGFDHDIVDYNTSVEGRRYRAGITFGVVSRYGRNSVPGIFSTTLPENAVGPVVSWDTCALRQDYITAMLACIDADNKELITPFLKPVRKYTQYAQGSRDQTLLISWTSSVDEELRVTSDRLWLLSRTEVMGGDPYVDYEGPTGDEFDESTYNEATGKYGQYERFRKLRDTTEFDERLLRTVGTKNHAQTNIAGPVGTTVFCPRSSQVELQEKQHVWQANANSHDLYLGFAI